ncbi:predicted protein [Ostreococcus lucimarinus CCE9901]|uniref:Inositol hexakisphosphate and diphosphoinositol-pentakisphosphate kinase n=1 Tax=Ostreococcus lucimarinus (strain CCE9901) TaxID=436017 RepID=A4RUI2_OSTLU|nr:predicted protein [Ostreococcus lucimarinus CCE9901]ABO94968.1 predicted protein [Ostreococcus lucimarinus CCE9901]|eukprot:XP_001416675.1 predicted protein [Ostreococcus lucimarinus CCE9901]
MSEHAAPTRDARKQSSRSGASSASKHPIVTLGVCAMDKKSRSSAMREILTRIESFGEFEIVIFGDECVVNEPVENWPKVDALIAFYSNGFPLQKVERYVEMHKPFVVNEPNDQWTLLDRRLVYKRLQEHDIPVPNHVVVNLALPDQPTFEPKNFSQDEEYVEINGKRIYKPFVEKPANAEDHNIFIYYPHSVGGGYKRLFRKIGNQSSQYYPPPETTAAGELSYAPVRETTSFIYEDFMSTNGTDVKVYTVGPNYAHAEARKSPVVDGRVQRDESGKEVRYPVLLTPEEKEIARRVCIAFGQRVCGFDLLRAKGRSYVCDVNGWSFVKNSKKYYDDASVCLRAMILKAVAPNHFSTQPAQKAAASASVEEPDIILDGNDAELKETRLEKAPSPKEPPEELRAVLGVIRHGDRTPKQKMKLRVKNRELLDLMLRCTNGRTRKQAKLKTPQTLQELLNICRDIYKSLSKQTLAPKDEEGHEEAQEELEAWKQVVSILEEGGHFSGINRKAQLKPLEWETIDAGTLDSHTEKVTEALLIIKFGGVLTYLGKYQAETLGKAFRVRMYPRGNYYGSDADGLLRLHSTYRHDLKIYSSDEGRVQITAAAFAKGLLALDTHHGQLTPILASLVTKDAKLLDFVTHYVEEDILHSKHKLAGESSHHDTTQKAVTLSTNLMGVPKQPLKKLEMLYELTKSISVQLRTMLSSHQVRYDSDSGTRINWADTHSAVAPRGSLPKGGIQQLKTMIVPAGGESFLLMYSRWKKLEQDLYHSRKARFDISKVPDVYDAVKYDAIHNEHLALEGLEALYEIAKELADCIVPNEYGTTASSKLRIGGTVANSLIAKLLSDLNNTREESFAVESGGMSSNEMRRVSISEKIPVLNEEDEAETIDEETEREREEQEEEEEELNTTRLNLRYATAHGVHSPFRHVRTRLYFTSESHLHSLINVLQYAHLDKPREDRERGRSPYHTEHSESDELDYLTHIVFRMFERFHVPPSDPRRFRIEILFSNGVSLHPFKTNAIELFDSSARNGVADEDEEMISDDLLKEIQIQNDKIMPGQDYLTLSTMEEYLVNYNRRWNKGGDSADGTPGKGARSSSVGSERIRAGKNLFT